MPAITDMHHRRRCPGLCKAGSAPKGAAIIDLIRLPVDFRSAALDQPATSMPMSQPRFGSGRSHSKLRPRVST
jgi:hypothetical protein